MADRAAVRAAPRRLARPGPRPASPSTPTPPSGSSEHRSQSPHARPLRGAQPAAHPAVPRQGRPSARSPPNASVRGEPSCSARTGSEVTAAKAYRLLRAMLNTAVDDGRISRNPAVSKVPTRSAHRSVRSRRSPRCSRWPTRSGRSSGRSSSRLRFTSMRWGELIALRRRDVDLDAGLIFVQRSLIERGGRSSRRRRRRTTACAS